jgi:hypothetical protein
MESSNWFDKFLVTMGKLMEKMHNHFRYTQGGKNGVKGGLSHPSRINVSLDEQYVKKSNNKVL